MRLKNPFSRSNPTAEPLSTPDLRTRYFKLQAQFGKRLWDSPEGCQLRLELERDVIRENVGNFVFASPATITMYWDMIDHLEWGCRHYLVVGEPGVGKDVLAQCIAIKKTRKLISVNCATLVDSIADALLFGISKEAGLPGIPKEGTPGFVGLANGQVLFLDEFFDAPKSIFPKLLRLLQEPRSYQRVGDPTDIKLAEETIIIAASNRFPTLTGLHASTQDGAVRSDLIDRFEVRLEVPPLRERTQEIGEIANNLLRRFPARPGFAALTESTVQALRHCGHDWPGNVRELERLLAAQARLQRHSHTQGPELDIPPQSIRDWLAEDQAGEVSAHESSVSPVNTDGVSAWEKGGDRKRLRLHQLLWALHTKKVDAGLGTVDLRWVSKSLPAILQVRNPSQKLRDSIGLNIHELASLLNEFSDTASQKFDELVTRAKTSKKPM